MWFWVIFALAAVINWGGKLLTAELRRRGEIICREEKLSDFWLVVIADVILLIDFVLQRNWFVLFLVVLYWLGWVGAWRMYLRHKDHDEDCLYGPRRKKNQVGARIRMFWKPRVLVSPV